MSVQEELIAKLKDPAFCDEVREWSRETLSLAETVHSGDFEHFENFKDDWEGSLGLGFDVHGNPEAVFRAVVDALGSPPLITADDLGAAFSAYLEADDPRIWGGDFDDLYAAFLDHVQFRMLAERHSPPLELCELWDIGEDDDDLSGWWLRFGRAIGKAELLGETPEFPPPPESPNEEPPPTLWSKRGLLLRAIGVRSTNDLAGNSLRIGHSQYGTLLGQVTGSVSEGALVTISEELIPVVRAIIRSASLLRRPGEPEFVAANSRVPTIRLSELLEYRAFVTGCVSFLFPAAGKNDTMARRFSNAVRLLSEADEQTSAGIALALSVTAIEALLGKKGSDISSSLADHVPVILEPETACRTKASKFVKDLYNLRSRTLHGEMLNSDTSAVKEARTLASACLYALWFRSDFKARLGEHPDTPEDLLRELRELKWVGSPPDCVPEVPAARALWR